MRCRSGWGPTDDGRIKPDRVTNGYGVYSSTSSTTTSYASLNGTSHALGSATRGTAWYAAEIDHYEAMR